MSVHIRSLDRYLKKSTYEMLDRLLEIKNAVNAVAQKNNLVVVGLPDDKTVQG